MGALAYADDLVLLAPTRSALLKLLEICSAFGNEYDVVFNPNKSKWLPYNKNDEYEPIVMDGKTIEKVNQFIHLGNLIGPESMNDNFEFCINKFNSDVSILVAFFGKAFVSSRYNLFRSYCMSLYGSQLWDFSLKGIEKVFIAWRKAIRFVWRLPWRTHCNLLPLISNDDSIELQVYTIRCFIKFIYNVDNSDNKVVRICA